MLSKGGEVGLLAPELAQAFGDYSKTLQSPFRNDR